MLVPNLLLEFYEKTNPLMFIFNVLFATRFR